MHSTTCMYACWHARSFSHTHTHRYVHTQMVAHTWGLMHRRRTLAYMHGCLLGGQCMPLSEDAYTDTRTTHTSILQTWLYGHISICLLTYAHAHTHQYVNTTVTRTVNPLSNGHLFVRFRKFRIKSSGCMLNIQIYLHVQTEAAVWESSWRRLLVWAHPFVHSDHLTAWYIIVHF